VYLGTVKSYRSNGKSETCSSRPAIPRNDDDLTPHKHIPGDRQHSRLSLRHYRARRYEPLYPQLAQRVTSAEVLRIVVRIGPTEAMHFQTWADKAGNAPPLTDPKNPSSVFPNLKTPPFGGQEFQTNLIMHEPTIFLSRRLPKCSIVRPTATKGAAMGALKFLAASGLFIGQSPAFFEMMPDLAEDADSAKRGAS
jgi:hypothetical protein